MALAQTGIKTRQYSVNTRYSLTPFHLNVTGYWIVRVPLPSPFNLPINYILLFFSSHSFVLDFNLHFYFCFNNTTGNVV